MKIALGHFDALQKAIDDVLNSYGRDKVISEYEQGHIARADKVKDLQKRFCFDMLYASNIPELVNEIYDYANDDHIYTALKRICPKVIRNY